MFCHPSSLVVNTKGQGMACCFMTTREWGGMIEVQDVGYRIHSTGSCGIWPLMRLVKNAIISAERKWSQSLGKRLNDVTASRHGSFSLAEGQVALFQLHPHFWNIFSAHKMHNTQAGTTKIYWVSIWLHIKLYIHIHIATNNSAIQCPLYIGGACSGSPHLYSLEHGYKYLWLPGPKQIAGDQINFNLHNRLPQLTSPH